MQYVVAALLASGSVGAWAATAQDESMIKLATQSGCVICHPIDTGAKGPNGLAPIGPAWQDVAKRYKGDKDAAARLTQTVLKGSNYYESHWRGKASGVAMPPNAVAISEPDARQLVQWILNLPVKP
jgi:cytochrome c